MGRSFCIQLPGFRIRIGHCVFDNCVRKSLPVWSTVCLLPSTKPSRAGLPTSLYFIGKEYTYLSLWFVITFYTNLIKEIAYARHSPTFCRSVDFSRCTKLLNEIHYLEKRYVDDEVWIYSLHVCILQNGKPNEPVSSLCKN